MGKAIKQAWFHRHIHPAHLKELAKQPRFRRLFDRRARHILVAFLLGAAVMAIGSAIAGHPQWFNLPHLVVDVVGYFLHAVGAVPILRWIEPAWKVLMVIEEEME